MGESLSTMLTAIGTVFASILGLITKVGETILDSPMLFVPFAFGIVASIIGLAVSFFMRRHR